MRPIMYHAQSCLSLPAGAPCGAPVGQTVFVPLSQGNSEWLLIGLAFIFICLMADMIFNSGEKPPPY